MNGCDELKEYGTLQTRRIRYEIYDELYRVLMEYETGEPEKDVYEHVQDMYEVLIKIQNNWKRLTN